MGIDSPEMVHDMAEIDRNFALIEQDARRTLTSAGLWVKPFLSNGTMSKLYKDPYHTLTPCVTMEAKSSDGVVLHPGGNGNILLKYPGDLYTSEFQHE